MGMTNKEVIRVEIILIALLRSVPADVASVRCKLKKVFDEAKTNVRKRDMRETASDILSSTSVTTALGGNQWVVAEVEGLDVQFSRLVAAPWDVADKTEVTYEQEANKDGDESDISLRTCPGPVFGTHD